jgi:hypothetical protein
MWALVFTRTTDGHVYSVRTFEQRTDAVANADLPKIHQVAQLEAYGECVDEDTRVSVLKVG